jgi:Flp pilus assembly protein protease CpaA
MYAQLLISVSFAVEAYQDVSERAVSDLVWIPARAGAAYGVYWVAANDTTVGLEFLLVKIALVGGIALAFTYLGGIGQADAIAMAFIAADPYELSPLLPLFAGAVVAVAHIVYEYAIGNAKGERVIPMEQFLKEQRWIPKAIVSEGTRTEVNPDVNVARDEVEAADKPGAQVEVRYGVPTVAYLGIGYLVYLVYLVAFNTSVFSSLP